MPGFREIEELLKRKLFQQDEDNGAIYCGPKYEKKALFYRTRTAKNIGYTPIIVPDPTFHPEVRVVFDFTHQFTAEATNASKTGAISSARPVSVETLLKVGLQLYKHFKYYYQYIMTYAKADQKSTLSVLVDRMSFDNEKQVNEFVNLMINIFLTTVSTEQVLNDISTANIEITDNANYKGGEKNRIFFDRTFSILEQLFAPMIPVMVWARGRFYKDWYFPLFDGYITSAEYSNNAGFGSINIACRDTLELARISSQNVNPSILQIGEILKQSTVQIYSTPFMDVGHIDIFNFVFHGGALLYDSNGKLRLVKTSEPEYKNYMMGAGLNFSAIGDFRSADEIPTEPDAKDPHQIIDDECAVYKDEFNITKALSILAHGEGEGKGKDGRTRHTISWGGNMTPYRSATTTATDPVTSEFSTRLDILQNVAQAVYFNFYTDGMGNVHYHPMRMANRFLYYDVIYSRNGRLANMDHMENFPGTQIIGEEETTSSSSRFNVEELVTFLQITGQMATLNQQADSRLLNIYGTAMDTRLMSRYGYRRQELQNQLFNYNVSLPGPDGKKKYKLGDLFAKALMQYANGELYTTTRNIIFRPELKIGRPVYFPYDDEVFFIQSISHNISINGDATTTVNANFGRKSDEPPFDLMNYMIMSEKAYELGRKDGGIPNLAANATPKQVQEYYEQTFGLDKIPFSAWLEDLDALYETYAEVEKQRAKEAGETAPLTEEEKKQGFAIRV